MARFQFELNQPVALALSGEKGSVVGRAEFVDSANSYRVRYLDATGRQQCEWFSEDALCAVVE